MARAHHCGPPYVTQVRPIVRVGCVEAAGLARRIGLQSSRTCRRPRRVVALSGPTRFAAPARARLARLRPARRFFAGRSAPARHGRPSWRCRLAMAFAIASGVKPGEQGIFTAIIAGFLISRSAARACRSAARPARSSSSSTASSQRYGVANLLIAHRAGRRAAVRARRAPGWARWCATFRCRS